MKNFFKSRTIQAAIIGVLGIVIGSVMANYFSQPTQQHNGNGDNVAGDKVISHQYSSFPAREVDPSLISSIEKCSNPTNPYYVVGVVESSLISGPVYDETDKFKDIVAHEINAESSTVIYRSGAIVPDGIKVWSSSSTNFVYIGQNSLSGKGVECIDSELKLGYSAWELRSLEFQLKSDGFPTMDFEGRIYDNESSGQETFSVGVFKYSDGKWRPGINFASL